MTQKTKAKLKAFFAAKSMDVRDSGGCETCGYGDEEGMSIEKINQAIDEFDEEAIS